MSISVSQAGWSIGVAWMLVVGCMPAERAAAPDHEAPGLYDSTSGMFRLMTNLGEKLVFRYGPSGLLPVSGDWDGDGRDSVGVFAPEGGIFFLTDFNAGNISTYLVRTGAAVAGLQPIAGDWDGDGRDGVGTFDPSVPRFVLVDAPARATRREVDLAGSPSVALAVAGDWRGDGRDGVGVYLPREGRFLLLNDAGENEVVAGAPRMGVPSAADLDGDGRSQPIVFDRASGIVWARSRSGTFSPALHLGGSASLPIFGRWSISSAPPR